MCRSSQPRCLMWLLAAEDLVLLSMLLMTLTIESAATSLDNFVILFPDPASVSDGATFEPQRVPSNISFANRITTDLQTLSTNDADPDGSIMGLLYVPDLDLDDPCYNISQSMIPRNVTRQQNLPNVDFNLIAVAPWINANCTKSYLQSAHYDPIRAFIFYLPNNDTAQPPPISNAVWSLNDGGQWKSKTPYPVYAVPGYLGVGMMTALSLYSGNVSSAPFGNVLLDDYGVNPRDYIRIYTELSVTSSSSLPGLWVFLLIVLGALAIILAGTSFMMHYLQRRRREALRRRVANGDVDLEALGIKRLTVPQNFIDKMPLFLYTCSGEEGNDDNIATAQSMPTDTKFSEPDPNEETPDPNSSSDEPTQRRVASPSLTAHDYLPHSQPTCPICLDDFESGLTTIRELPCLHIFHPECIDSFLSNNSSLCPMCKKSTLPRGYCPSKITNAMVTRERAIRRLRGRINLPVDPNDTEGGSQSPSRFRKLTNAIQRRIPRRRSNSSPEVRATSPAYTGGVAVELQPRVEAEAEDEAPRPREQNPHLSRGEIVQLRARELLGGTVIDDGLEGRQPGWRKAISKVFPGFK